VISYWVIPVYRSRRWTGTGVGTGPGPGLFPGPTNSRSATLHVWLLPTSYKYLCSIQACMGVRNSKLHVHRHNSKIHRQITVCGISDRVLYRI